MLEIDFEGEDLKKAEEKMSMTDSVLPCIEYERELRTKHRPNNTYCRVATSSEPIIKNLLPSPRQRQLLLLLETEFWGRKIMLAINKLAEYFTKVSKSGC